jgi:hypothetical protein
MPKHQARNPVCRPLLDNFRARVFHHLAKMNARRADGFACAAIEAPEHVFDEGIRDPGAAFIEGAHQVDAAAG